MSQKQYTTYQADITSFELRDAMLGLLTPGRYRGYDTMVANGAQVGNDIPITINHSGTGISKYDKQNPPVQETIRGIALTKQGTIIAEDGSVNLTVTLRASVSGGVHTIYMIHAYEASSAGANPATYGIVSATGSNAPTLPNPTMNIVLGYIIEAPSSSSISGLTYYPVYAGMGDQDIFKKLFRGDTSGLMVVPGTEPAEHGIIGNRNFSSNNYLTDYMSLTQALGLLDEKVGINATAISTLDTFVTSTLKLDDLQLPDDNTDLNASITRHGLFPKLVNDASMFLNGIGNWVKPQGKFIRWRAVIPSSNDFTYSLTTGGVQDFDLSSIVTDTDADLVIIEAHGYNLGSTVTGSTWSFYTKGLQASTGSFFNITPDQNDPNHSAWEHISELTVKMDANRIISISMYNGTMSNVSSIGFRVKGWQTAG